MSAKIVQYRLSISSIVLYFCHLLLLLLTTYNNNIDTIARIILLRIIFYMGRFILFTRNSSVYLLTQSVCLVKNVILYNILTPSKKSGNLNNLQKLRRIGKYIFFFL
jgi:hypothetical protein